MTLGATESGVTSLTGESGRGLEGDRAGSDFERQHISHTVDGVWLTYVQNWQIHWLSISPVAEGVGREGATGGRVARRGRSHTSQRMLLPALTTVQLLHCHSDIVEGCDGSSCRDGAEEDRRGRSQVSHKTCCNAFTVVQYLHCHVDSDELCSFVAFEEVTGILMCVDRPEWE